MAKKKRKASRPPAPAGPEPTVVADAAPVDDRAEFAAAQRAAVRRTTTGIVLFCILVGLATAAILIAGGGPGQ